MKRLSKSMRREGFRWSTHPYVLHVERNAVRRNTLMVRRFENIVFVGLINETFSKFSDFILKLVGREDLVRKSNEAEVKVV